MVSKDQLDWLGYDTIGVLADVHALYTAQPWLDLQLGVLGGLFSAAKHDRPPGGVIAPLAGLTLRHPSSRLSPFFLAEMGPAVTGEYVRVLWRLGVGIDIGIRRGVSLGPIAGYTNINQKNGPQYSTDARFIWAGLSLCYRPAPPPPPKPAKTIVIERWNERVEEVRLEPEPTPHTATESEADRSELLILLEQALPATLVRTEFIAPVLFKFDSDTLEPIGTAMLHEVARTLSERTELKRIAIEGYADRRGSEAYNLELAGRRAQRVYDWLIAHGVEAERLRVVPAGATGFVEDGEAEPAHEQNRRVIFRVLEASQP